MGRLIGFEHVSQAVALTDFEFVAARQIMAPAPRGWQKRDRAPSPAAVLILITVSDDDRLQTVLTLRNAGLRGHSGQVSFPGGRQDPQDKNLQQTALRETCEEIGICGERVSILGQLPQFYIPASHHDVCPIVAADDGLLELRPNPAEVAQVFCFALEDLLQPRFKSVEQRVIRSVNVRVPYYEVAGHKVWGATAMLLSELEGRLCYVLPKRVLQELRERVDG
ncbi:MAG: CoA pyrophosphatase [Chloroflexota bacterium]|nr:CoA pyrophosphatase [Chloroflexota bacterium]MDE2947330.1 CoA pyrophosphatase [Chloroflexota bacterium]